MEATLMRKIIITGSAGLIGSEAVRYYDQCGDRVIGIDNNMRRTFFGPDGDTSWQQAQLVSDCRHYEHHDCDIRDRNRIAELFRDIRPDVIIHCAAQPSHD